jgi:hypothetical protein
MAQGSKFFDSSLVLNLLPAPAGCSTCRKDALRHDVRRADPTNDSERKSQHE